MGIPKGESKKLSKGEEKTIKWVGENLKKLRKSKGYSSYENLAFDKNIPRMMVYRLEAGKKDFNFTSLIKVLEALDTSLNDFFQNLND